LEKSYEEAQDQAQRVQAQINAPFALQPAAYSYPSGYGRNEPAIFCGANPKDGNRMSFMKGYLIDAEHRSVTRVEYIPAEWSGLLDCDRPHDQAWFMFDWGDAIIPTNEDDDWIVGAKAAGQQLHHFRITDKHDDIWGDPSPIMCHKGLLIGQDIGHWDFSQPMVDIGTAREWIEWID
jgi:hypothetical protein